MTILFLFLCASDDMLHITQGDVFVTHFFKLQKHYTFSSLVVLKDIKFISVLLISFDVNKII